MTKKFQIKKVKRCLKFAGVPSKGEMYEVYKLTGPRGLTKYFRFKYEAKAWLKNHTTNHPLTTDQIIDVMRGR
jgi:hypothetical protein